MVSTLPFRIPPPDVARIPMRRRVIVIGATEAGTSAAFHLGDMAMLLDQCRGSEVVTITAREHLLALSTGESFVYDKLVSALRLPDIRRLITDEQPTRIQDPDGWRYWLASLDIELLDVPTQIALGDLDGTAAGKRLATSIRCEMTAKYATKSLPSMRMPSPFRPTLVGSSQPRR